MSANGRSCELAGVVGATEKRAASSPAEHEAAEQSPDASAAQDGSLTVDSTIQRQPVPFSNNILTLDVQEGKPVSPLGYIGELPNPPAKPVPEGSLASTPAKTEAAAAGPSSTAVVFVGGRGQRWKR